MNLSVFSALAAMVLTMAGQTVGDVDVLARTGEAITEKILPAAKDMMKDSTISGKMAENLEVASMLPGWVVTATPYLWTSIYSGFAGQIILGAISTGEADDNLGAMHTNDNGIYFYHSGFDKVFKGALLMPLRLVTLNTIKRRCESIVVHTSDDRIINQLEHAYNMNSANINLNMILEIIERNGKTQQVKSSRSENYVYNGYHFVNTPSYGGFVGFELWV